MKCSPVRATAVLLAAMLPLSAGAAEITRIASSFEPNHPFGMYLDVQYVREQTRAKLVRENHQNGTVQDAAELNYLAVENRMDLSARIGLWQDLEFRYTLPLVVSYDQTWNYAGGSDAARSTIANNCLRANGELFDPNCPTSGAGAQALFGVPNQSFRGGLGDMHFALSYALFNENKDPTKPMWILSVDYQAPTANAWDPTQPTAPDSRGGLGEKIHRYTFATSLSKRVGIADPYFQIHYTLPFRGPGWYSNCDHPDPSRMGMPENCGQTPWTREETGIKPAHTGGMIFGSEFNAYDSPSTHQKVAIDVRALMNYTSEGRYFNPLTDVTGKLLYTDDNLEVGGALGLIAWAAEYVGLNLRATLTYTTEHTLTDEQIGKDLNGNTLVDLGNAAEINPNFDYRVDMPSRRFRATEQFNFGLQALATFSF